MRYFKHIALFLFVLLLSGAGCSCDDTTPVDCEVSGCPEGEICDTGGCRLPITCGEAGCLEHQLCEQPPGEDARCLEECEEGWAWQPAAGICGRIGSTCQPGVEGSILSDCEDAGRACVEEVEWQAACGD